MKIYLIEPVEKGTRGRIKNDPWANPYDKCFGMVIAAKNIKNARLLAYSYSHGSENRYVWLAENYTNCRLLAKKAINATETVILRETFVE